jgi:hypothetical protein
MSKTPETDELNGRLDYSLTDAYLLMTQHSRKIERERDVYANALRSIHLITIDGEDIWADLEEITTIAHNALHHHE